MTFRVKYLFKPFFENTSMCFTIFKSKVLLLCSKKMNLLVPFLFVFPTQPCKKAKVQSVLYQIACRVSAPDSGANWL